MLHLRLPWHDSGPKRNRSEVFSALLTRRTRSWLSWPIERQRNAGQMVQLMTVKTELHSNNVELE